MQIKSGAIVSRCMCKYICNNCLTKNTLRNIMFKLVGIFLGINMLKTLLPVSNTSHHPFHPMGHLRWSKHWFPHMSQSFIPMYQGVVSLTFRELSKLISRKYTTPEILFMIRILSWNFVHVHKAWVWAHVQSFSLKFWSQALFLQYTNFERIFWRARETFVKQPPGTWTVVR